MKESSRACSFGNESDILHAVMNCLHLIGDGKGERTPPGCHLLFICWFNWFHVRQLCLLSASRKNQTERRPHLFEWCSSWCSVSFMIGMNTHRNLHKTSCSPIRLSRRDWRSHLPVESSSFRRVSCQDFDAFWPNDVCLSHRIVKYFTALNRSTVKRGGEPASGLKPRA